MSDKQHLYQQLCNDLAPLWQKDAELSEHDPEAYHLACDIDSWLYDYKNDPRVGVEQYARNCARLRAIYLPPVEERAAG